MEKTNRIPSDSEREKIIKLIEKAIGPNRTMADFAKAIDISAPMLTRIMQGRFVRRLSIDLIKRIDENRYDKSDQTLFDELYDLNGYSTSLSRESLRHDIAEKNKETIKNTIISYLISSGIEILEQGDNGVPDIVKKMISNIQIPTLHLKVKTKDGVKDWYFHMIQLKTAIDFSYAHAGYLGVASRASTLLLYQAQKYECFANSKISFVVLDEEVLEMFEKLYKKFLNIPVENSILVFDINQGTFIKEESLTGTFDGSKLYGIMTKKYIQDQKNNSAKDDYLF